MSGAQSWSVKGIDPKVREAAREAAARQGMSLGEYLSQALAGHQPGGGPPLTSPQAHTPAAPRTRRYGLGQHEFEAEDEWNVGATPRTSEPARLIQRIESIERRTQLAVTGLDRAVSTIDRSVLGLAARIEDAEAASHEASDRIADALEQFRVAGETLSGKLQRAESEVTHSRQALDGAKHEISGVKERLESQVAVAEEVARRAEAAASYLTSEMENRESSLKQTLSEARRVAEEAARQASEASADAVSELRRLQEELSERVSESEASTRRAVEAAVAEVNGASREDLQRLEAEVTKRIGTVDQLRSEQAALISRIERAEAGTRETTAGLRQAAGAAIADLRNSQLTLAARLKQVEDGGGSVDVGDVRQQQQDIAERLAALESKTDTSPVADALNAFERRLAAVEGGANLDHVDGAVKTLDHALQRLSERIAETESTANTAIRTLEETVSSLGARVEQTQAIQETEVVRAMLEQRLDTMAQSVSQMVGEARTELAEQLQNALEGVAGEGLEGALADVNRRLAAAERRQAQTIEAISLEIRRMSETVDKRLRSVESRNDDAAGAAVREELARMTTTLEARFDEIERREAAAFDRMGLEVGRLSERLEERVGAVESRSAQAIEQVGEQVARMGERFNHRQDTLARELGERMIDSEERASQRVSDAIGSIMQRLAEVEEHSAEAIAPVQKAVSGVATRLNQFEAGREGDIAEPIPSIPTPTRRFDDFPVFDDIEETEPYISPMDAAQPMRAAPLPPLPPLPQQTAAPATTQDDIYFEEDGIDDLLSDDDDTSLPPIAESAPAEAAYTPPTTTPDFPVDAFGDDDILIDDPIDTQFGTSLDQTQITAPPADEDPFWSPEITGELPPLSTGAETVISNAIEDDSILEPAPIDLQPETALPAGKNDYLANARKAAQAQSLPKTRETPSPSAPRLSLRGSSRIILWGATGLVALMMIGGAKWWMDRQEDASVSEPQPEVTPPTAPPPATSYETAPTDPFAEAPAEGFVDPATAAPTTTTPQGAPIAQNGTQAPVTAGPLPPRAVATLEQAAQSGDLTAQYELALQRLQAGRAQEGVTLLRRAADRGFAMAQYRLAKLYERGEGVGVDLAVARQWTERAAAGGNRRAMHDLGVYFARGEGAPLDEGAAFRWFRQAAELGVADSQYNLGVLYQQGRGVNTSSSEALFWFLVAARQGDQDAGARATALEGQLQANQVEQARARAQAFRPRAASAVANGEFGQRAWARSGA
jgi:localization factor PodJL